ncbi:MAG: methionyl-tRNA formyltransferase [Caldimonas sp.]
MARLCQDGFDVRLVLTQPDRPAGRGLKLQPSAVKAFALERGIPTHQPRGLRLDGRFADDAAAARDALLGAAPDVLVVAAYGLILPAWVIDLPAAGCLNIHASLLPRWRGAAPIHRAIEAGDSETGVTIMQMDEGLDTGPMLLSEKIAIAPDDTTATLQDRLSRIGGELMAAVLARLRDGERPSANPQPDAGATYARKVSKDEAAIDWCEPASVIERRLRAFDPFPGATGSLDGDLIKCWRGRVQPACGAPGEVIEAGDGRFSIACGEFSIDLLELQRPGGRRVSAAEFLQRGGIVRGMRFESTPI